MAHSRCLINICWINEPGVNHYLYTFLPETWKLPETGSISLYLYSVTLSEEREDSPCLPREKEKTKLSFITCTDFTIISLYPLVLYRKFSFCLNVSLKKLCSQMKPWDRISHLYLLKIKSNSIRAVVYLLRTFLELIVYIFFYCNVICVF